MKVGTVVEFTHHDTVHFGVVVGEVGPKLKVLIQSGDELRPLREALSFVLNDLIDANSLESVVEGLSRLRAAGSAIYAQIDLKLLWELSLDSGEAFSLDELSELMLGEVSDATRVAILLKVREDTLYFKLKDQRWEPRSLVAVAERRALSANDAVKQASRDLFVERVCFAMSVDSSARDDIIAGIKADPTLRSYLDALMSLVINKEFDEADYATGLLNEVEAGTGGRLPGEGDLKPFRLLVSLGILTEHQNLPLLRFGIEEKESAEVLALAEELVLEPRSLEGRQDYSGWFTLAVDDAATRDVDDALSIRPMIEGGWKLAVHVSDPSALMPKDGVLDRAAKRRGTSVYPPTGTIPMIPRVLSEGGMSLLERVERPALTLLAEFDTELNLVDWEFAPSRVTVNRRLSYREADAMLESDSLDHVTQLLGELKYIADERALERAESGAVVIDLPEPKVHVTMEAGEPKLQYEIIGASPSRAMIQEMMVLYNHLAARWFEKNDVPGMYRIQHPPESRAMRFVNRTPPGPPKEFARLKSMKKAEVSTHLGRHHGLGIDGYIQMTSPIRRYNDLVMQRQMVAVCRGEKPPYSLDELLEITAVVEQCSLEASKVNRESDRYWIIYAISQCLGEALEAVVLDYRDPERQRATVMLTRFGYRAVARLRHPAELGDTVRLVVERAEARRNILTFHQN